jgi:hypothetical protein
MPCIALATTGRHDWSEWYRVSRIVKQLERMCLNCGQAQKKKG